MKNAQKNYLDRRLNEVKTELIGKLKTLYKVEEHISVEARLQSIISGEVGLNVRKLKEMLEGAKLGHGSWAQWQEVFDFSAREAELKEKTAPMHKAIQRLEVIFQNSKDTIMLGSESEALEILKSLQGFDVAALAKQFPPVEPAKKAKAAPKKKR